MTSDSPLRLVCLSPYAYDSAPNMRFRFEQWAPELDAHGVKLSFVHFAHDMLDRAQRQGDTGALLKQSITRYPGWVREVFRALQESDGVIVPIKAALAGPPLIEAMLHGLGVAFVYDVDDGHHLGNPRGGGIKSALIQCDWRVPYLGRWAKMVSVGNEELATYYRGINEHVTIWPTTVSMSRYTQKPTRSKTSKPLVVGWTGSPHTAMYLQELLPMLATLQSEVDFEVFVFGAQIDLGEVRGWCEPWTREREVAAIHEMDLGLMPLTDDPWARCKCGFKAIQYLATGVPALVSDVGVNAKIVEDGISGYVIKDDSEWAGALRALLGDASKRARFGQAGRAHIQRAYSNASIIPLIAADLKAAFKRDPAAASRQARSMQELTKAMYLIMT